MVRFRVLALADLRVNKFVPSGNDPDIMTAPALVFVRNNAAIARSLNFVQKWQQVYSNTLLSK
jgi:hypothetical protein